MNDPLLTPGDLAQLAERGISETEARRQLHLLRTPPSAIVLDRPCVVGDGVTVLDPLELDSALARGQTVARAGRVVKFVPASGAATRMFKDLLAAEATAVRAFLEQLDRLPFGAELRRRAGVPGAATEASAEQSILHTLLDTMGYAERPKALVPFHGHEPPTTAFEDQLVEGVGYTRGDTGVCRMHFTVAPRWLDAFSGLLSTARPALEARFDCTLDVTFSTQHPSTDTLAIDALGMPFRTASGSLLFRPAGHGALIDNLGELAGDVVVIKNIDNILPEHAIADVIRWKLVLIGLLAQWQAWCFERVDASRRDVLAGSALVDAVAEVRHRFGRHPQGPLVSESDKRHFVAAALDRPLRVVGVVRNEGEPGGAPFWVRHPDGSCTPQIVESAQVDAANPAQQRVFASSTHFNPVDLVCGLRDVDGRPFDLRQYVDPQAVFLSSKSHEGRALTALERPGLWNGAMAHWNTVCVEVPSFTFAPVKTVFDLLRPQHQR